MKLNRPKAVSLSLRGIAICLAVAPAGGLFATPANKQELENHSLERYPWKPFRVVQRPEVPGAGDGWARNPVDAFIADEHEKRGLSPRPAAAKEILLRRVSLDLVGLNPSPAEVRAFLADQSEDAYEKVVERLLSSPRHGERWGRHWMDIWRYSDWAGYRKEVRDSQPHIWRWRDWIVESLNADKGYDRMILEMLAADELAPEDDDALRATGYLVRNFHSYQRDQWLDNVVKHTSQAFLGVTMGCAKCHDHKYDAIPQEEYYRMRAVFEPYHVRTDQVPGELDTTKAGLVRAYDKVLDAKTHLFERGDERRPVVERAIEAAVPGMLGGTLKVAPVSLPMLAYQPHKREFVEREMMAAGKTELEKAREEFEKLKSDAGDESAMEEAELKLRAVESRKESLELLLRVEAMEDGGKKDSEEWKELARKTACAQRAAILRETKWKAVAARNAQKKGQAEVDKAAAGDDKEAKDKAAKELAAAKKKTAEADKALAAAEERITEEATTNFIPRVEEAFPSKSTGRRLAFANWLTSQRNPLTARVAMNHIWLRHFGQAIVPTVTDFGGNGRAPTHPALLDWLAAEFMSRNWSMKEMHRLIVTSSAYRMAGTPHEANTRIDPDNIYLWRMPSRRMEGEIVRDNLLHAAGELDEKMGGPEIDNNEAQTSKRRSIYLRHAHEKLVEFVQIFDGPKVSECYMREESIQPHQALALANSKLTFDQSRVLSERLGNFAGDNDDVFLTEAFLTILGRHPKSDELDMCREFVGAPEEKKERARRNLVMVLFNHNDFVTIR